MTAQIEVKSDLTAIPYPPSWLDRLNRWAGRLPIPAWLFYGLLGLFFITSFSLIQWAAGQYPVGTFYPLHLFIFGTGPYLLALIYYLDRYAHTAMNRFRPALSATPEQETLLRYQLTTIPARSIWYATFIGVGIGVFGFLIPLDQRMKLYNFADTALSIFLYHAFYIMSWITLCVFVYHSIHQLRLMNIIFTQHARISLFHRRPLFGFAWLSAYTAIGVAFLVSGVVFLPGINNLSTNAQSIALAIFLLIAIPFPLVTFLWPLLGIHRLLTVEKEHFLDENGATLERTMSEIRQRVSSNELADIEKLHKILQTVESEDRLLKQIPTWPWQPEALRSVVATLLLPIILWMIQQFLQRFLR